MWWGGHLGLLRCSKLIGLVMYLALVGCVLRTNHCKWCIECTLRGTRSAYYETYWSEVHNQINRICGWRMV